MWATFADGKFLDRIDRGEIAFRRATSFDAESRSCKRGADGLHTEYTVVEILEHIPRPTQLGLDELE